MNKYLIEILKIQSSVILPSFGSLMITNSKTGKIVFNPHLKFNDGALANYIAEKEGTDKQAAQNQIAKFIREIEAELGKGNDYNMFEFGSFIKDKDGNVDFKMDPKGAIVPADSKPVVKTTDKTVQKEEKTAEKTVEKVADKPKDDKATLKAKAAEDKKAAKEKAAADKVAAKAKAAKDKAAAKTKAAEDKAAAKAKAAADKLASKTKPTEEKPKIDKVAATEKIAADEAKQEKNKFVPVPDKKEVEKVVTDSKPKTTEKLSAVERATGDAKIAAELKKPEIKTETKKDTTQDKNTFKPTDDKKETGTSKAAITAMAASGSGKTAVTKDAVDKVKEAAPKAESSTQSIKDKYKKSATDKKQKGGAKPPKEKKEKKKKSRLPLIIILIILLGGGGTAGYFYKDQITIMINGEEVATEDEDENEEIAENNEDENSEDEINEDENSEDENSEDELTEDENLEDEIIEDEVVEDEVIETVVDNSTGGNYHVIGNAFSESANADNYVSSMKSKGFGSAKVLGRFDNLYMVSIQQFDSQSAASSGASSAGDGAWVFKYPK